MKNTTDSFKAIITELSKSFSDENIEFYKLIIDNSPLKQFDGPEEFFFAIKYPFNNFMDGYIRTIIKDNPDVSFIYCHFEFIDAHFCKLFEKIEGPACCADKARNLIESILNYYLTKDEIKFNYDAEYTYHLPNKILKTHESIIDFYIALKRLFYGDYWEYVVQISKLSYTK